VRQKMKQLIAKLKTLRDEKKYEIFKCNQYQARDLLLKDHGQYIKDNGETLKIVEWAEELLNEENGINQENVKYLQQAGFQVLILKYGVAGISFDRMIISLVDNQ
jgi:hypothetical protein